jgi:Uncharacterised ACR, YagE family COG1723
VLRRCFGLLRWEKWRGCVQVSRTRKQIAQLIGMVFIQKSNVNLLSTVLDTPEYFWSAPDSLQARPAVLMPVAF